MKKLICFVATLAMVAGMSLSVFAAGISAKEQALLDQAKAKAAELGVAESSAEYQKYMSQANTFLAKADLDEAQVNTLIKSVDEAAATAKAEMDKQGVKKVTDLDKTVFTSVKNNVVAKVTAAAKDAGITVKANGNGSFTVSYGDVVVSTSTNVVKQTGADLSATVAVAGLALVAVAGCAVVASKKRLFA